MPIDKKAAIAQRISRVKLEVSKECFDRIDQMLCWIGPYTFSLTDYPPEWREVIIQTYSKLGWSVEYVSDPRDGNYLIFS